MNDPNGLVYFSDYYHVFYQHCPHFEKPWQEPMHWGHARTKDFINWEELPIALYPDKPYDYQGCWSGTAIVKDGILYLFYASIYTPEGMTDKKQTVSVAYSKDGIHFEKYENNPIIDDFPDVGGPDFRDPAITCINGKYYCVMATGQPETKKARLLLYESENLFDWKYHTIMGEWDDAYYTECPSIVPMGDKCLLAVSIVPLEADPFFRVLYGTFDNGKFKPEIVGEIDKGPDQYAGQMFLDAKNRCILVSWIPGWAYSGFSEKDIGCLSVPREIFMKNGKLFGFPIEEVQHLLRDSDPAVKMTDDGFVIERIGRENVVYRGKIEDLKIIRDEYILEIFINGGEETLSIIL